MKISGKFVVSVVLLGLIAATPAFARQGDKALDLTLDVATEPATGFGSTVGFTAGGGYEVADNLQVRGDISYYNWSQDVVVPGFGFVPNISESFSYTRIPLDVGVRYFFQLPPKDLKVYAQGELEISFDSVDTSVFGVKETANDVHAGVVLGGGVDYALSKEFSIGANLKGHIITDGYVTLGFGGSYHF